MATTTLVREGRKLHGAGNGNGGNVREQVSAKAPLTEDDSMLVLQEIMRLAQAAKDEQFSELRSGLRPCFLICFQPR